jgi:hypothetical protein
VFSALQHVQGFELAEGVVKFFAGQLQFEISNISELASTYVILSFTA